MKIDLFQKHEIFDGPLHGVEYRDDVPLHVGVVDEEEDFILFKLIQWEGLV